jgi:hypothetical protein
MIKAIIEAERRQKLCPGLGFEKKTVLVIRGRPVYDNSRL